MLALLLEAAVRSFALGSLVWLGLKLLRVRDPRAHMTAWTVVLVASLAMPLVMHRLMLTVPLPAPVSAPLAKIIDAGPAAVLPMPAFSPALRSPQTSPAPEASRAPAPAPNAAAVRDDAVPPAIERRMPQWPDGLVLATAVYVLVAGILVVRLLTGILLTWRLMRAARPLGAGWAAGRNVRVSDVVGVPVTFGSTVLLPPECTQWSPAKRQAVLCHERSHVARGDCYVLLLAALNRAVFWFSPFAWWQFTRLAELAEMISDDAAIAVLADRQGYAHILLDLAGTVRRAPAGLAMARVATVGRRVERILAAGVVSPRIGWRKQLLIATALVPAVAICAGSMLRTPLQAVAAIAVEGNPSAGGVLAVAAAAAVDPQALDSYAGYYRLDARSVVAIRRSGARLFAQSTGERTLPLFPDSDRAFLYKAMARITFVTDGGRRAPGELILREDGHDRRAARIADVPEVAGPQAAVNADVLDSYAGWYELNPTHALAVTREGDHLVVQITGRPKLDVFPRSEKDFVSADGNSVVIFMPGSEGRSVELLLDEPGPGARSASRVDAARATAIDEAFARRVAAAPGRFADQTPAPGGKPALLRAIEDVQRNAATDGGASPVLAEAARRNLARLRAMLSTFGPTESLFFRGVGPGGYDIYGAKFARGFAEFRLLVGADGKIEDVVFRPDGDDTPGGFADCSDEATLKPAAHPVPIKLLVHNASGADIELFALDPGGKRVPYGTLGEDRTAPIETQVGRPWIIADASGQCREIVLPGQRARFLNVQSPRAGEAGAAFRRSMPLPGSDDALLRYIDGLARGEPAYADMTPELAAQTRRELPLYHGILAKLGAVRAMSFRGATQLDNDIYMIQFANGAAEWRIGLVKQGRIARIALGPQY